MWRGVCVCVEELVRGELGMCVRRDGRAAFGSGILSVAVRVGR